MASEHLEQCEQCEQRKVCTKCKQALPLTSFHKDKSKRDGYECNCKICKRIPHPKPEIGFKKCCSCKNILPREHFYKKTSSPDGIDYSCKECCDLRNKKYSKANPERVRLHKNKFSRTEKGMTAKRKWYSLNGIKYLPKRRQSDTEARNQLLDRYVRACLILQGFTKDMVKSNPELITIKRGILKIKRHAKQNRNSKP